MGFEIDYFWASSGLVSVQINTDKNFFLNMHILPRPEKWLWGRNHRWHSKPGVDFGLGPIFRITCVQL